MSEAIQSHLCELSHAHLIKMAKTIGTVENTDLLEQPVSQIEGGIQKIANIPDKCVAELKSSITKETRKKGME